MTKFLGVVGMVSLCGCSAGVLGNPALSGQVSGMAAGLLGIPAATAAAQVTAEIGQIQTVAQQLQMLKAQLDGTPIALPPLPGTGPVVIVPPGQGSPWATPGTGPIVTPTPLVR